jgi:hypothetical protein
MKKKEQFDTVQEEIQEEEKLVAIAAEKEQAYEKNSPARVVEKVIKQIEELGEQLERTLKKILHIDHHIINGQGNSSSQRHLEQ